MGVCGSKSKQPVKSNTKEAPENKKANVAETGAIVQQKFEDEESKRIANAGQTEECYTTINSYKWVRQNVNDAWLCCGNTQQNGCYNEEGN